MKVVGDVTVSLPYVLNFCAKGPDVEPIVVALDDVEVTLFFPPSMSDGTVGQSFFPSGWAWWTGSTLRLTVTSPALESQIDVEEARRHLLLYANHVLRRFLNAYRVRFHQPQIHAVLIDPKEFVLSIRYENGVSDLLPEPESEFFFRHLPSDAPLNTSVNTTTLDHLRGEITSGSEVAVEQQLVLDAEWLESIGESDRANFIRKMLP
jgi:hypothetical protein